ncbi:hypothetical protein [Candidatus Mycoplasma haematohominis]|uniref:hypothetical protein n=1 Tax=Candidatus Mycoplasma haematohominis TaxID=1494318 RepID=UPI001C0A77D4|nr:hypothetical protein [Candidatus Mycoplasma haemohominis]
MTWVSKGLIALASALVVGLSNSYLWNVSSVGGSYSNVYEKLKYFVLPVEASDAYWRKLHRSIISYHHQEKKTAWFRFQEHYARDRLNIKREARNRFKNSHILKAWCTSKYEGSIAENKNLLDDVFIFCSMPVQDSFSVEVLDLNFNDPAFDRNLKKLVGYLGWGNIKDSELYEIAKSAHKNIGIDVKEKLLYWCLQRYSVPFRSEDDDWYLVKSFCLKI